LSEKFQKEKVSVIITTLNEEKNIQNVLDSIPSNIVDEILVVDGYSTDKTVEISQKNKNVRILYDTVGKGSAVRKGIENAKHDIIVLMDGDMSHNGNEINQFVDAIKSGYDVCFGSRFLQGGRTEDMPWYRKLANNAFVKIVNWKWKSNYTDLCYGYRAIRKSSFKNVPLKSEGFTIETELSIVTAKHNLQYKEVPSFEKRRMFGEAKLKTWSEGYKIFKTIIKEMLKD